MLCFEKMLLNRFLALSSVLMFLSSGCTTSAHDAQVQDALSDVVINEVNCKENDWVEIVNRGDSAVSLSGWILSDKPIGGRFWWDLDVYVFPVGATIETGDRIVIYRDRTARDGFPFGIKCGEDVVKLYNSKQELKDEVRVSVQTVPNATFGRYPDTIGEWTWSLPTPNRLNQFSLDEPSEDNSWIFNPLGSLTQIFLEIDEFNLSSLKSKPRTYVKGSLLLAYEDQSFGPFDVGIRLKGTGTFRDLSGKAALKIKFSHSVDDQRFFGLKGLTLNNMVRDASMMAEAVTSHVMKVAGVSAARVGYSNVFINEESYGLYANVETVDLVMLRRLGLLNTFHLYEGEMGADVGDRRSDFLVDEGSNKNRSDLESLSLVALSDLSTWWDDIQLVINSDQMLRVWAIEHYVHHFDGYSMLSMSHHPNNYYLHSDTNNKFSMIPSGTDGTWNKNFEMVNGVNNFGVYGKGLLFRQCVQVSKCKKRYIEILTELYGVLLTADISEFARKVQINIRESIQNDLRREFSVEQIDDFAGYAINMMELRPKQLSDWLASPQFNAWGE